MKIARFHFDDRLLDLTARTWRATARYYHFNGPQSLKHLVESLGIPHTEVGEIRVNGQPGELDYIVADGDEIEVSSADSELADSEEPRFVADGHLGRLNSGLRMLGLDCAYGRDFEDAELVHIATTEHRILLTRDRRLLMRKVITRGYLVRSSHAPKQMQEVVGRFSLPRWIRPFQRCIRCNGILKPVEKRAIVHRLEPLTRRHFDVFHMCPGCGQIYWKGSHYERMLSMIATLQKVEQEVGAPGGAMTTPSRAPS